MENRRKRKTKELNTRNERKEQQSSGKLIEKIRKKIMERSKREGASRYISGDALMLGKIAYDLSRSGTEDQINDIEKVSSTILSIADPSVIQSLTKVERIQQAYLYSESAFVLSLSGIKNSTIYETITRNIVTLLTNLQFDINDDLQQIVDSLANLAISGVRNEVNGDTGAGGFQPFVPIIQNIVPLLKRKSKTCASTLYAFLQDMESLHNSSSKSFGYWLHSASGGPLMALWLHSTKQKKLRCVLNDEAIVPPGIRKAKFSTTSTSISTSSSTAGDRHDTKKRSRVIWGGDSPLGFADMTLPLVVDVGCGFGVSLLGMAAMAENSNHTSTHIDDSNDHLVAAIGNWNCLGCDLSTHCIRYAQSIATRWNLSHRCRFCVAPADDFVEWVKDYYPGPVVWLLVQYPTPYALQLKSNGNIQLPVLSFEGVEEKESNIDSFENSGSGSGSGSSSSDEGGFMVTHKLINILLDIALKTRIQFQITSQLYIQSNVEDVAVTIKHKIESHFADVMGEVAGFSFCQIQQEEREQGLEVSAEVPLELDFIESIDEIKTKRQELWEGSGGERIEIGCDGWLRKSPLPIYCRTETEASYALMNKQVYRIGWKVVVKDN